jgi:3-methyl-2-oxobutanoate hydroxymethyltransferase
MLVISMGGGTGCDAQYLFAEDVLGINTGHMPRHARRYRDFAAEYARLQKERIAAFGEFKRDVESGAYPASDHIVSIKDDELELFLKQI